MRSSERRVVFVVLALLVLLAAPRLASGAAYCVAPASTCDSGDTFDGVQPALDAARNHQGPDSIELGAAIYGDAPYDYFSDDLVVLFGAGQGETVLTMSPPQLPGGNPAVLRLGGPRTSGSQSALFDMTVVPPSGTTGVDLRGARAVGIQVVADPGADGATGVSMSDEADLDSSSISLAAPGSTGIRMPGSGSVRRGFVQSEAGVITTGAGPAAEPTTFLHRTTVVASCGVRAESSASTLVQSSLIFLFGECGAGPPVGLDVAARGGTEQETELRANNVTVIGNGGVGARSTAGDTTSSATPQQASLTISESILYGTSVALVREGAPGIADLTTADSNYDARANVSLGEGGTEEIRQTNLDPQFVDTKSNDFRLRDESPLIDRGGTDLRAFESLLDLDGGRRILDGTIQAGVPCEARRDLGAFEYQPAVLAAVIAPVSDPVAGEPAALDASASCDPDPGATLSYAWVFDDGSKANGSVVLHVFADPGRHAATLMVTSSRGRSGTVRQEFDVIDAGRGSADSDSIESAAGPTARDAQAPSARRLEVSPSTFAAAGAGSSIARTVGSLVRYRLSEPAVVRFTVERQARGKKGRKRFRKVSGSFSHKGRQDSNKFRFTGRLADKKLRPGTYRLIAVPSDSAGNRGDPVRARFKITR
jgi:hypothetical protein